LVFCQCVVNGVVASVMCVVTGQGIKNDVPHLDYLKISSSYLGAMFFSNYSLNFISYPTQALAKACKMIPVMLSRIVINGKTYKLREYLTVLLITAGIAVFMLNQPAKSRKEKATSYFGLMLLFGSLLADGFTGPTQENLIAQYKPTSDQVMTWMNVYSVLISGTFLIFTGEMKLAILFLIRHPDLGYNLALFCCLSAVGQKIIMLTLFRFDSLVLTMVTTTRKFFTILASVIVHGSVLSSPQWGGVAMVFLGVSVDVYYKAKSKQKKKSKASELTEPLLEKTTIKKVE